MVKTAEFGHPVARVPQPGTCRICGWQDGTIAGSVRWSEAEGAVSITWADESRTICSNPSCIEAAKAELTLRPGEFLITPADLAKAGIKPVDLNEAARVALAGLSAKIEHAKAEAFGAGLDFAHGPVENESDDPFAPLDIWRTRKLTVTVKAGPVARSFVPPRGWVVYRNPDYDGPVE